MAGHVKTGSPRANLTDNLVREDVAAEILGLNVKTLRNWRVVGGGPPFAKLGGSVRYSPAQVRAWAGERLRLSSSEGAR
jgi:hypothetical protein